jgi:ribosome maturation factor RimP
MGAEISKKIEAWLQPKLEAENLFLVEVKCSGKKIEVFVDGMQNVTIDKCAEISRFLEEHLDGEAFLNQNYLLEVSSPGMFSPLKVKQQYQKRMGRELDVLLTNGEKVLGKLIAAADDQITLEETKTDKKTKKSETITHHIDVKQIKKAIVNFKF